jgi:hypothetical protein
MIVTKMALPRRTFLRGAGVTLALPMLDAMVPALAAKSAAAAPPRLGFFYVPNGMHMPLWKPRTPGAGKDLVLSQTLMGLNDLRQYVTVLGNLNNYSAGLGDGGGPHTRNQSAWLSGTSAWRRRPTSSRRAASARTPCSSRWKSARTRPTRSAPATTATAACT